MADLTPCFSHGRDDWGTEQPLYALLHQEFGFTLDVCASDENHKCPDYLTPEIDGLAVNWWGRVFMNPPFTRTGEFLEKMMQELECCHIDLGVALVAARTDTTAFHRAQLAAGETRYLRGRCRYEIYPNAVQRLACWAMKDFFIEPDGWGELITKIGLPKVAIKRLMLDYTYQGAELAGTAPFPSAVLIFDRRPSRTTAYWDWRKHTIVPYVFDKE